jgi:YVTN family beta-propeller protein
MPRVQHFLVTPPLWLSLGSASSVVSDSGSDDCSIFDARTRRQVKRVKVGKSPKRVVFASVRK